MFKGIIQGKEIHCTGSVTLDVVFETPDNYRIKALSFDIVPFCTGYHALFGQTTFTRFHVMPHYSYMSGTKGIITVCGNSDRLLRTEDETASLTIEAQVKALAAEELFELRSKVDKDNVILAKCSKTTSFKPNNEVVKFQVHPTDPSKMASIGTSLGP